MVKTVEGTYRNGRVELSERPDGVPEEARVIVTFVEPGSVDLERRGISEAQAARLRDSLTTFTEEWESPEMGAYDDYVAARAQRDV